MRATLFAVLGVLLAAGAAAQEFRIGYVNTGRIETESVQGKRAIEAMKREFGPREEQIVAMQKQIKADQDRFDKGKTTMPQAELKVLGNSIASRMRESDQIVYALQADIEQRKKEVAARMFEDANAAIKTVAEQGKYDLVVHEAIYARASIDITNQVLKEMARRAGN